MLFGTGESYDYFLCRDCGSLSIIHVPSNLTDLYESYPAVSSRGEPRPLAKLFRFLAASSIKWVRAMGRLGLRSYEDLAFKTFSRCVVDKSASILDVGCGNGGFVRELYRLGYTGVIGIDPNCQKEERCPQILIRDIFDMDGCFDFVTFHHSFEHMANPKQVLIKVQSLLSQGGLMLIRLPSIDSYSFSHFREHWDGIHAPYHLCLPSKIGMLRMADMVGLKVRRIYSEQLVSSFLNSVNHTKGIADFAENGMRHYLENFPEITLLRHPPPDFTIRDILYWLKMKKKVLNNGTSDYIGYVFQKN